MKTIFFLSLSLLVFSFSTHADDDEKLERIHWEKDITEPTQLVFKNHYGDIRLRSTEDQKLVFHGVAQSSKEHKIKVEFNELEGQIICEVVFADVDNLPEDHRLDAVIIVPSLLTLNIDIENGKLSSKGLNSSVIARSVNSNINIKSSKNVSLFSKNGDVIFYAKAGKEATTHQLTSHKGDINVFYKNKTNNFFSTTAGTESSSNDAKLLLTKTEKGRAKMFGNNKAKNQFKIQTDTGFIRIINQKN